MQTMEVISINIWQILISLCNLLILFLILKKFLYEPVRRTLESRRVAIDSQYQDAETAKRDALADKTEYANRLATADAEAKRIRDEAVEEANRRGEKLMNEAKSKADDMVRRAEETIKLDREKAAEDMKSEIADVSSKIAEKLIKREINDKDQHELIDSFINDLGDSK